MEYFFNDVNVMQTVLRDNDGTGISLEHAATLISSRFAFTSIETVQQALYALFDLELHGPEAQNVSRGLITTTELFHSISAKALPLLVRDPNTAFQHRFHHLIQYGGKYYAYLVARSSANLIWNSVFRADPFNRQNGLKWAEVQSHGGGFPPNVLLKSILGYSPTPSHLIKALKEEAANVSCLGAVNI
ncbi:unnamed protein product [Auanema sp. JU1783]|nr:unnamed protein product [Auanema sp. JU1783]